MSSTHRNSRQDFDWDRIKQRLALTEEALTRGFAPSEEMRRAILHARAKASAQAPQVARSEGANEIEVVIFKLAQEHYALESKWVQAVHPLKDLTTLPCTPAFVLGIVHLHGRILSVIDLRCFFGLPKVGMPDLSKVLVLSQGDTEFAIVADSVVGVNHLAASSLQTPLATWPDQRVEYARGVTAEGVVLLDALKLIASPALVVDQDGVS